MHPWNAVDYCGACYCGETLHVPGLEGGFGTPFSEPATTLFQDSLVIQLVPKRRGPSLVNGCYPGRPPYGLARANHSIPANPGPFSFVFFYQIGGPSESPDPGSQMLRGNAKFRIQSEISCNFNIDCRS